MICSRTNPKRLVININRVSIEQVQNYNCLGRRIKEDGQIKSDILSRTVQVK